MVEFGFFRSYFFLLNFAWGKGLTAFLLALMYLGPGHTSPSWNDNLTATLLLILAILLPIASLMHYKDEVEMKWVML